MYFISHFERRRGSKDASNLATTTASPICTSSYCHYRRIMSRILSGVFLFLGNVHVQHFRAGPSWPGTGGVEGSRGGKGGSSIWFPVLLRFFALSILSGSPRDLFVHLVVRILAFYPLISCGSRMLRVSSSLRNFCVLVIGHTR
jgi:hypothetical protein